MVASGLGNRSNTVSERAADRNFRSINWENRAEEMAAVSFGGVGFGRSDLQTDPGGAVRFVEFSDRHSLGFPANPWG